MSRCAPAGAPGIFAPVPAPMITSVPSPLFGKSTLFAQNFCRNSNWVSMLAW
ncbi:MAG: hypothetical protein ACRDQ5_01880 [Sciscionella sp.]